MRLRLDFYCPLLFLGGCCSFAEQEAYKATTVGGVYSGLVHGAHKLDGKRGSAACCAQGSMNLAEPNRTNTTPNQHRTDTEPDQLLEEGSRQPAQQTLLEVLLFFRLFKRVLASFM